MEDTIACLTGAEKYTKPDWIRRGTTCQLMETGMTLLGHKVDKTELHLLPAEVKAVPDAPHLHQWLSLKLIWDCWTFRASFCRTRSLHWHLCIHCCEKMRQEQERTATIKQCFIALWWGERTCDGVGAVMADGDEKPTGCASCTLTAAEKKGSLSTNIWSAEGRWSVQITSHW